MTVRIAPTWALVVVGLIRAADATCETWLGVGDPVLRDDVLLLADSGVIHIPTTHWPMPLAELSLAIDRAVPTSDAVHEPALSAALDRARRAIERAQMQDWRLSVAGGKAARMRDFDDSVREDGEIGVARSVARGRFSMGLALTGALSPNDGLPVRFDGSHVDARFGNWIASVGAVERFWGPAWASSLILSNNARPMPALVIERATSAASASRWFSWIGPWRATAMLARMESERIDVDRPLFLGVRLSIRPLRSVEIGFSRTAQFCGEGQACGVRTVKDLLLGNDNIGIDTTAAEEPGNQMAGFDLRLSSPWDRLPLAVYSQFIGEDESSYLPVKNLAQFGAETWVGVARGGSLRATIEFSDTSCAGTASRPRFDCAYVQRQYNVEGYRYRGRVVGHSSDSDSQIWVLGLRLQQETGAHWQLTLRDGVLNRDPGTDLRNTVSVSAADYSAAELAWRRRWRGGEIELQLGGQRYAPRSGSATTDLFGAFRWQWHLSGSDSPAPLSRGSP